MMQRTTKHNILALTLLSLTPISLTAKCSAPALALPYRETQITPGTLVQGIRISIGSPPQYIALTPSLMLDNAFIPRYTNSCVHIASMPLPSPSPRPTPPNATQPSRRALDKRDGHPGDFEEEGDGSDGSAGSTGRFWEGQDWWLKCSMLYGGGYAPALSGTGRSNASFKHDEFFFDAKEYGAWTFLDDVFALADYLGEYVDAMGEGPTKQNISGTFVLPNGDALFGGLGSSPLGLTPESTVLNALAREEIVASTSWSLTNETLCLGCWDKSASKGDFTTFKPADRKANDKLPCLIQAKVEALNWRPGENKDGVTLIKEAFSACIEPGIKYLVLPNDVREAFETVTDRKMVAGYDDYVVFSGPPKDEIGVLEFKLEGGLQVNVTIPGAGKAGAEEKGEWRVPVGKGGWGGYGTGVWTLGKPFTDHIVLKWDAETKEYSIANVNEDASRTQDLQPLGCDEFPKKVEKDHASPATGTIVGSVVGGFVGGLLFAAAGLLFYRRGVQGVKAKYEPMPSVEHLPMSSMASDRRTIDSAMSGALSPPSIRDSMLSRGSGRVSPMMEPQMVDDNSIYEAPEGGTAYPTKRERTELGIPPVYHG
ncbi:hypothetical protein EJ04DRAFT_130311 [Polyplosphaeria fusca]|uniref:Peptidase A1 domain-containing protein n=1 Tax=Polyplosphaeria fusca TaxID=682080 RepID=A0A9P4V5E3_9PLEO|nr:hypothetical protein EJ04DRAFT_130311 [Polyplosphaeria fusca]